MHFITTSILAVISTKYYNESLIMVINNVRDIVLNNFKQ